MAYLVRATRALVAAVPTSLAAVAAIPVRMIHAGVCMDGNTAASHVAYGMSEMHTIFPITPASTMGEAVDEWNTQKRKNMFGNVTTVTEMESEMGVAGSVHGAAMAGALVSTFTSSQGLLLMLPNFFRLLGGLYPAVVHVAARSVAGHSLDIYGDHTDVMTARATGVPMMCSNSVQEVMDLAAVAHMTAIKSSLPMLHFFDGFKTSHEVNTVIPISYETLYKLFDHDAHKKFMDKALSPYRPDTRGTMNDVTHNWQIDEASHPYLMKLADIVQGCMDQLGKETGRHYKLFDYYGAPDAERVVIILGSGAHPVKEMIDHLGQKGEKVGLVMVRLYRPFQVDKFIESLPKSVKRIAVLDRTREPLASGDPLFLDVKNAVSSFRPEIQVVGGRYGIGGKEFNPVMAKAVFDNLKLETPKDRFLAGINDDVCNRSLPLETTPINSVPAGTTQCLFWGLGSDGTVGANKQAIKIIGTETEDMYGQGNFVYSSHKSGGITISHLRFGPKPQTSSYNITSADYIACSCHPYLHKYQVLDPIKENGTFVLNSPYATVEEMDKNLPNFVKKMIAERKIHFYNINATELADKLGLQGKTNMIMQSVFFSLSKVLPEERAVKMLKNAVKKEYGRKGKAIVQMNWDAIDKSVQHVKKIEYPSSWADLPDDRQKYFAAPANVPEFLKNVFYPCQHFMGDTIPVSAWVNGNDARGVIPPGLAALDKRAFASHISQWENHEECSQCNMCSALCPHAAIRPFLYTAQEGKAAGISSGFKSVKAKGAKAKGLNFSIQVSGSDCTGCGVCVSGCPDGVLELKVAEERRVGADKHFQEALKLPEHTDIFDTDTLKGSQFITPYLQFNGACAGCAEPAILKAITQLYGDEMFIANVAGCTCVWLSTYPMSAIQADKNGHGPAYGQGLFEDGAEFGFGMYLATQTRRDNLKTEVEKLLAKNAEMTPRLKELLKSWVGAYNDRAGSKKVAVEITKELTAAPANAALANLKQNSNLLARKTQWVLGGDGWAYDINFQGIDHVLAQNKDVKILVLDNEVYANTGGQASKSTPRSSVAKFAQGGKKTAKKDLGAMMMTYGNVYVAQVCWDADPNQALKAVKEAEAYDGPALIINYAPCINHGITGGLGNAVVESKKAVEEGYWNLYRFNPVLAEQGKNPMIIDAKPKKPLSDMLKNEVRYSSLHMNIGAADAKAAHEQLAKDQQARFKRYEAQANSN